MGTLALGRRLTYYARPPLVVIESPYAGDVERNEHYARRCARDSFDRGEFPFLSHLLYTQPGILDDTNAAERTLGITAGFAWAENGKLRVFYVDLGVSGGMKTGARAALLLGTPIEIRALDREVTLEDAKFIEDLAGQIEVGKMLGL